jgi:hypothetical protein
MKSHVMIAHVHNKGLKEMAGEMVNEKSVHLLNSFNILQAQINKLCAN